MTETNPMQKVAPYEITELAKYFDPLVFGNLGYLTISGIGPSRLTVAFWDISGFSKLCNELIDSQLIEKQSHFLGFLKEYFDEGQKIISKYHGVLDKFLGDGILAYFGYPEENSQNSPTEAVMAALEFGDTFKRIKQNYSQFWLKNFGKEIEIDLKCGLHTGLALFGIIETQTRKQVTVLGSTVNFSSRLVNDVAVKDEIIISRELKNIIENHFDFMTKRVDKPIPSYENIKTVFKVLSEK